MNAEEYGELVAIERIEKEPTEALAVLVKVKAIAVIDQASLTIVNEYLREAKAWLKKCDEEFDEGIAEANVHHKNLVAQKNKWTAPAKEVEAVAKPKIRDYLVEQDRIRLDAERAVQRAKEVAAKEAQDAADVAIDLIKEGKAQEADEVIEMVSAKIMDIQADAPFVPSKPVAKGTSLVKRWTWDRDNIDINKMAADPEARKFLKVDEAKVTRHVQNFKWDARIEGIHIYSVDDVASRSGK